MTWFEAQEVYEYVTNLEEALQEWALSKCMMASEQVQLSGLSLRLNREIAHDTQRPSKGELLRELCNRIQECQDCIAERLKS